MAQQEGSSAGTLKDVLTLLFGLSITNGLVVLVAIGTYNVIAPLENLALVPSLLWVGLLLTGFRFYQGNARLLVDTYLPSNAIAPAGTERHGSLPIDYTVILFSAILLALLSFYICDAASYCGVMALLLFTDIVWFASTRRLGPKRVPRIWTINNSFHVAVFAVGYFLKSSKFSPLWIAAVFTNSAIDIALSGKFYFPPSGGTEPRVFLAAPLTQ
jgi:hypothetical protein